MTTKRTTRRLLACGVVAAPLFFAVAFGLALTRDGFDLSRHMISQLATGHLGWLQVANFLTTGGLYVACAVGMRHAGVGTWGPRLVGTFGVALVAAGVFVTDPAGGFPPQATNTAISWHGVVHGVAAVAAGLALLATAVVLARRFAAHNHKGWAAVSAASGVLYLVIPWAIPRLGGWGLAVASIVGWGWLSATAGRLLGHPTATPDPSAPDPALQPA